jgi:hypothetical protein
MPLWQNCTPPRVIFTSNNCISSALSKADIGSLFDIFSRNARLLLMPRGDLARGHVHPVAALMCRTSTDFYKWYTAESKATTGISLLKFVLLDIHTNAKQTFFVDGGNLRCFQMLKQSFWDSFWSTLYLNGAPPLFEISISHIVTYVPNYSTCIPTTSGVQARSSTNTGIRLGPLPRLQFVENTTRKKSDIYYVLN